MNVRTVLLIRTVTVLMKRVPFCKEDSATVLMFLDETVQGTVYAILFSCGVKGEVPFITKWIFWPSLMVTHSTGYLLGSGNMVALLKTQVW